MENHPFEIRAFASDDALAAAAAAAWLDAIAASLAAGRDFTVALSGGRVMSKFLVVATAMAAARAMDFSRVRFFWADERGVPPDDPESNFHLANEALLQPAAVPAENIHRLCGELAPAAAVEAATRQLREVCGAAAGQMPTLDLVLLGMGEDGHVASLFPDDAASAADLTAVFLPVFDAPKPPPIRISLGHGPLAAARSVWVLASGPGKQAALHHALAAAGTTPLAQVLQRRAMTTIFTDISCELPALPSLRG
ncbi:MAG: 6-phosphogluconolactonase [Verrucomicrobia bacterium]|nr:MAG: 6-phosphogluconolactonase [Verrucomicrobiota bacterium]